MSEHLLHKQHKYSVFLQESDPAWLGLFLYHSLSLLAAA